jgi:amidophosphoribosyltransferase
MRISSPPVRHSCRYGIDTPTDEELIANSNDVQQTAEYIGVDSLAYLSLKGLERAAGADAYCNACFSGDYPIEFHDQGRIIQLAFEGL